jgi:lipoate-protein ligase B
MEVEIFNLGLIEFKKGWDFQKEIFDKVSSGLLKSALVLCRHYPVVTLGRNAKKFSFKISQSELKERGIKIYPVERGGGITYHGPGQQIFYPIFNLRYFKNDLHLFLRYLEEMAIGILTRLGIFGQRLSGLTGVWVNDKKISSVGIAVKNWISYHGLSLNIKADDLFNFSLIRPCGMDIEMTSVETLLGREVSFEEVTSIAEPSLNNRYIG